MSENLNPSFLVSVKKGFPIRLTDYLYNITFSSGFIYRVNSQVTVPYLIATGCVHVLVAIAVNRDIIRTKSLTDEVKLDLY